MKKKRNFLTTGYDIVVFDCDSTLTEIEGINLFIGFGGVVARPIVAGKADIFINCPTLSPILALARGLKI